MGIHIDASEVRKLAVDLGAAPARMRREAEKVLLVGANKIKRHMRADASGHRFLPELGSHVAYDRLGAMEYEIGINKVGQGNLGNIAAYGTSNNAPVFDHTASLRREAPTIERLLADAAEKSALGDG